VRFEKGSATYILAFHPCLSVFAGVLAFLRVPAAALGGGSRMRDISNCSAILAGNLRSGQSAHRQRLLWASTNTWRVTVQSQGFAGACQSGPPSAHGCLQHKKLTEVLHGYQTLQVVPSHDG
jgi:hypothetical protein